jgi:C4-dicarboxylate-specific signal transduction histidine kinase
MMALGKLSAGLAHELNNPVAAVVRSAVLLGELLSAGEAIPETCVKEDIEKLLKSIVIRQRPELTLLQRSIYPH